MNLILWRHAEAEDGGANLPDEARRLTKNGLDQASRMAKWLNNRMPDKPHILVSPSTRTQQTADALGLAYQLEDRLFTSAGVDEHMEIVHACRGQGTLILVAHQPTLGALASLLLCGKARPWDVRKGSIWWLQLHGKTLETLALTAVISPELL